jgi:FKBP-type peptidyl-prolyl cis-trans isomerase FkpA
MMVRFYLFVLLVLTVSSCNNSQPAGPVEKIAVKDEMIDVNKYLVQKDNERIENYIARKNLTMKQTPSGLWYTISKEGTGDFYKDGSSVSIDFDSSLLDGTQCYSSTVSGPKAIVIGKSDIESGLYEGLKLLKPGSEAVFILPPYLAYGLLGDGNLIPARAVIVYKVKVLESK